MSCVFSEWKWRSEYQELDFYVLGLVWARLRFPLHGGWEAQSYAKLQFLEPQFVRCWGEWRCWHCVVSQGISAQWLCVGHTSGKFPQSWSFPCVVCERKRSGSANISLFVGIDFWGITWFSSGIDDGIYCDRVAVMVYGGDSFVCGKGVGQWCGGGGGVWEVLLFTTWGCWILVVLARNQRLYCWSSLFRVPSLSNQVLQSFSSWFNKPHQ